MRLGVRLGIDLGEVRIGVARCDYSATLALPVATVKRAYDTELAEIADYVQEFSAIEIVIGLPRLLSGSEGKNSADVRQWAKKLAEFCPECPIRLVDERLTTVTAHSNLQAAGLSMKKHRQIVDQQAAVLILEQALEIERGSGSPAGTLL